MFWVAACTIALFVPATASAEPVAVTVTVPPGGPTLSVTLRSPLVESLVGGDDQVLDAVDGAICGPLTDVAAAAPAAGTVGTTGCAVGALDFQFVTRLGTADGEIVRKHVAVMNTPTPLNVDADAAPDVVGTLFVTSLNRFGLRVDRVLTDIGPMPLRIEAIVDDPTDGALPRERINVGFDTRQSSAPMMWRATATLPDDGSQSLTTIEVEQEVTGAGDNLTTLGGLFDGDALDRKDPLGGRLRYTPVPPTSTIGLTLGDYIEVRAGAVIPTVVNGVAEIVEGPREQEIRADITGLPPNMRVRYEEPGADRRTVTYDSVAPVPALDASYTDTTDGSITSKAVAHATGLPTGMVVRQTGPKSGDFVATGGQLGSVEVGYANGEPVLMDVDHPYARVVQDGTLNSYAGRIDALVSASVDATDDVVAELQLGLDGRRPFRALVEQSAGARTIDGRVSDLPRHLTVQYDPDNGRVDYDGFGETIEQIDVEATQATPFFGRVTKIAGTLETLPPQATVTVKPEGNGMKLQTTDPIGEAEVLLTSGPDSSLPAGTFGAKVEDLPDRFTAFGRVSGLRLVDVTTGAGGAVTGHMRLASTPLKLIYEQPAMKVDADLSAIPGDVTVAFDPAAGKVDYSADAGIDRIDALVTSSAPLFGEVKRIQARVDGLPNDVSVGFKPATGSGVEVAATPGVDMVEAALTDGRDIFPTLPEGKSGAIMRDLPNEFSVFARIFEVQSAKLVTVGNKLTANLKTGPVNGERQDIDLDATIDVPDDAVVGPMRVLGFVQDLPGDLTIEQNGSQVTYDANDTVPKVTLDVTGLPGGTLNGSLDGDLHNIKGTLIDVPTQFKIVNNATDTGVEANGPFTRVDVEAWDHGDELGAFPDDGRNKVTLDTRDGRLHAKARAFGLEKVLLGMLTTTKVETEFGSAPAPLDVAVDGGTGAEPLDLDVDVEDLPTSSTFELGTLLGTQIGWDASSPGTDVGLNLSAKDVGAVLDLPNLPQAVDVCVGGGQLGCDPSAPSLFQSGSDTLVFPNAFTAVTEASDTITLNGKVCLPPTDDDGEALDPPGTVYGACIDNNSPNRIEITNLRLKDQRLEFASGDTINEDEDGDPIEDDLLKLYLQGDTGGIKVDNLLVRNDTSDSSTIVKAGHTGGPPLRHNGNHFFLLADMTGIPNTEIRQNQIECDDLEVRVDLPLLGLTDVLPSPGEIVLGDVCID